MSLSAGPTMQCSKCGAAVQEGYYYVKEGKVVCIGCVVSCQPSAKAFIDDDARKQAEKLAYKRPSESLMLEATARRMAMLAMQEAERALNKMQAANLQEPSRIPAEAVQASVAASAKSAAALADAERLVKLAQQLDTLADKLFARG